MEFLLDSHAKFFADIESLKESQQRLIKSQEQTDIQIKTLADNVEAMRIEMRDAIENLIVANEVTRDLAQQIGKLAIQTAQRVTKLEEQNGKG